MWILFVLFQSFALDTSSCLKMTCSTGPSRKNCIQQTSSTLLLSPCVTSLYCDTTQLNTQTST